MVEEIKKEELTQAEELELAEGKKEAGIETSETETKEDKKPKKGKTKKEVD